MHPVCGNLVGLPLVHMKLPASRCCPPAGAQERQAAGGAAVRGPREHCAIRAGHRSAAAPHQPLQDHDGRCAAGAAAAAAGRRGRACGGERRGCAGTLSGTAMGELDR